MKAIVKEVRATQPKRYSAKAKVIKVHFDRADRGRDGTSVGYSSSGVATIKTEDGRFFEIGVGNSDDHTQRNIATGVGLFLKDGQLTEYGLAQAGYEHDPFRYFRNTKDA